MLNRRTVCASLFAAGLLTRPVFAQVLPFKIRIVRDTSGLPAVLSLTSCIPGQLFIVSNFNGTIGEKVCDTVELPYVFNMKDFSAIPTGRYAALIRDDGTRGWRIELSGTGARHNVQIHTGNRPTDVSGCILLGSRDARDKCAIVGGTSKPARDALRARYGPNNFRPIELGVEEA